jgi:hypothetical protein
MTWSTIIDTTCLNQCTCPRFLGLSTDCRIVDTLLLSPYYLSSTSAKIPHGAFYRQLSGYCRRTASELMYMPLVVVWMQTGKFFCIFLAFSTSRAMPYCLLSKNRQLQHNSLKDNCKHLKFNLEELVSNLYASW